MGNMDPNLIGSVFSGVIESYKNFVGNLSDPLSTSLNLLLLTVIVVIYAIFIWKFYTFISTKDIIKLNLRQYSTSGHPFFSKISKGFLYFLEYIVILPILIFFWFVLFSALLLVVAKDISISRIILISALTIAAVRVVSYVPNYGEKASAEIAKIVPITLLGLSMTNPNFFDLGRVFEQLTLVPSLFSQIKYYLLFTISIELIMRFVTILADLFTPDKKEI